VSGVGQRLSLDSTLLRGVQVLVIDDDSEARDLLRAVLEYCGAQVVSAESAVAGLASLGRVRPDVVVCDLVMPGDDGYALVRALRTRASVAHVPVVALTAYAFAHGADRALEAGFDAYLKKPVEPWDLCRTIDRLRRPPAP
jgi:CheY-like chemotaxis protein